MDLTQALWNVLGFGVLPLWLGAGAADWMCHRRSHIERTSGPHESVFHVVLHLSIAVPALLALWFEINAMLLAVMATGVIAHMVLSWWDTSYSQPRRYISPFEQQVHSHLEMLPLFALVIVCLLNLDAVLAPQWQWIPRAVPVARAWVFALALGFGAGLALIIEEWWRGFSRAHSTSQAEKPASAAGPRPSVPHARSSPSPDVP